MMIKIIFWWTIFFKLAATSEVFEIRSCNDQNKDSFPKIFAFPLALRFGHFWKVLKIPQLTYQIAESYFDNNEFLSEARDDFQKKNGFYERSVDNADLIIQFADKDCE